MSTPEDRVTAGKGTLRDVLIVTAKLGEDLLEARDALYEMWRLNHQERCTNNEDCESFGVDLPCYCPRPDALPADWRPAETCGGCGDLTTDPAWAEMDPFCPACVASASEVWGSVLPSNRTEER